MPDQSIIAKINALLELADETRGGTENERDVAMQKAQQLMLKHNIEMGELIGQTAEGDVTTMIVEISGAMNMWKRYFYSSIVTPSFCKLVYSKTAKHAQRITVFGRPDNLRYVDILASHVIPWLEDECKKETKETAQEYAEYGQKFNPRAFKRSFMESASSRIYSRLLLLRKEKAVPDALIRSEDAANDRQIERTFGRVKSGTRGHSGHAAGHRAGAAAGNRADLSPGRKLNA